METCYQIHDLMLLLQPNALPFQTCLFSVLQRLRNSEAKSESQTSGTWRPSAIPAARSIWTSRSGSLGW